MRVLSLCAFQHRLDPGAQPGLGDATERGDPIVPPACSKAVAVGGKRFMMPCRMPARRNMLVGDIGCPNARCRRAPGCAGNRPGGTVFRPRSGMPDAGEIVFPRRPAETAPAPSRPVHDVIGENRRSGSPSVEELPIDHRENARLVGGEDHVCPGGIGRGTMPGCRSAGGMLFASQAMRLSIASMRSVSERR